MWVSFIGFCRVRLSNNQTEHNLSHLSAFLWRYCNSKKCCQTCWSCWKVHHPFPFPNMPSMRNSTDCDITLRDSISCELEFSLRKLSHIATMMQQLGMVTGHRYLACSYMQRLDAKVDCATAVLRSKSSSQMVLDHVPFLRHVPISTLLGKAVADLLSCSFWFPGTPFLCCFNQLCFVSSSMTALINLPTNG